MAKLTLDYEDVYTAVSNFLGLTVTGTAPTGTNKTTCEDIVARGLRQFLYPIDMSTGQAHDWNFLKQYWTFTTVGDQWKYALPDDFSDLLDDFHFDSGTGYPHLLKRSAQQIKEMRAESTSSSYPEYYAIVPSKYDLAVGTTYELWLYPTPNQGYNLATFYRIDPLKPSATADLMVGGIRATEAILESCLAVAETQEDEVIGLHSQIAADLIQKLIVFDTITDSDYIGNLYRDKGRLWPRDRDLLTDIPTANIYSDER